MHSEFTSQNVRNRGLLVRQTLAGPALGYAFPLPPRSPHGCPPCGRTWAHSMLLFSRGRRESRRAPISGASSVGVYAEASSTSQGHKYSAVSFISGEHGDIHSYTGFFFFLFKKITIQFVHIYHQVKNTSTLQSTFSPYAYLLTYKSYTRARIPPPCAPKSSSSAP